MGDNLIRTIVKEKSREQGISLAKLAFELGVNQIYLLNILHGRKISRPLIAKIAQKLHLPDLPDIYETFLRSNRVENKLQISPKQANKKKSHKGGKTS